MTLNSLPPAFQGVKSVSFFGLGKSNLSLLCALALDKVTVKLRSEKVLDRSLIPKELNIHSVLDGERAFLDIDEELIIASPSLRRERAELLRAREGGVRFTSDAELFFTSGDVRPVIGITGSDGKSTTATLIHKMLSKVKRTALIGNIGTPMYEALSSGAECYVAELSSFMLRYARPRLECAAITSLSPNHLNWHADFEEYRETKLSILRNAKRAVLSADSPLIPPHEVYAVTSTRFDFEKLKNTVKCEYYFTYSGGFIKRNGERLASVEGFLRKEDYYIKNCLTALAVCEGLVPIEDRIAVISSFGGLSHRCERFLTSGGVDYVDSSIDTTPQRCIATLGAIEKPTVLILGGRGKGASYGELIPALGNVRAVIATGEDGEKISRELGGGIALTIVPDFKEAVLLAKSIARAGEAVLLSPAATSYDAFSSYEERGEEFKRIIYSVTSTEDR